jgi:hypothetical protein
LKPTAGSLLSRAACVLAASASVARAQSIEPRAYSNAPVGVNFLLAGPYFTRGGLSARTGNSFDLVGVVWQYRWGGGL